MKKTYFHAHIYKVGESPCEKFKCHFFNNCATKKLACYAFYQYYDTGDFKDADYLSAPLPNKQFFDAIFKGETNEQN
jgi:hypothetical protein